MVGAPIRSIVEEILAGTGASAEVRISEGDRE